jgi:putative ABC transport system permease protein
VVLVQNGVVERMQESAAHDIPNIFLIDISTQELPGLEHLLAHQPGVIGKMETLPVVSARIATVDGTDVKDLDVKNYPKRLLQSVPLSWSAAQPAGMEIVRGKWWAADDAHSMAVTQGLARRLHLHLGSKITFLSNQRSIETQVTAIVKMNGQHIYARTEFVLAPSALAGLPVVWYGAVHVEPPLRRFKA